MYLCNFYYFVVECVHCNVSGLCYATPVDGTILWKHAVNWAVWIPTNMSCTLAESSDTVTITAQQS